MMAAKPRHTLFNLFFQLILGIAIPFLLLYAFKFWLDWRPRPAELAGPSPEVAKLIPPGVAREAAAEPRLSARAVADLSKRIKSVLDAYRERVRKNPHDEIAARYLEVVGKLNEPQFKLDFEKHLKPKDTGLTFWYPAMPMPEPTASWLRSQAGVLKAIDRLCATSGTLELDDAMLEALALSGKFVSLLDLSSIDVDYSMSMGPLLLAAARLELQEGRPARAQRYYLDLLELDLKLPQGTDYYDLPLLQFYCIIRNWIASPDLPAPDWAKFLPPLERFTRERLTREKLRAALARNYFFWRKVAIDEVEVLRNITPNHLLIKEDDAVTSFRFGSWNLPRIDQKIDREVTLLIRGIIMRQKLPSMLRRYDLTWRQELERAGMPWSQASSMPPIKCETILYSLNHLEFDYLEPQLKLLAHVNLIRTALHLMIDPELSEKAWAAEVRKDPLAPWLDPYTDQPLKVSHETTHTLIYSVGPDLIDQHGQLDFYRGSRSSEDKTGDIILRIPRQRLRLTETTKN